MNQSEIKKLAIECGADEEIDRLTYVYVFTKDELAAYTAAVEAPLQARIAQLEEALKDASEEIYDWGLYASDYFQEKYDLEGCVKKFEHIADNKLQSTWLSEHDKVVEAKAIERCALFVADKFDENEPWITPEEIRGLE